MERCTYIEIEGKEYPMRMTIGAREEIHKRYGSMQGMINEFKKEDKCISSYIDVLHVLISQGCAYKNMFESDIPKQNNAPVKNGKYIAPEREWLTVAFGDSDIKRIVSKISECAGLSRKNEISGKNTAKKNRTEE